MYVFDVCAVKDMGVFPLHLCLPYTAIITILFDTYIASLELEYFMSADSTGGTRPMKYFFASTPLKQMREYIYSFSVNKSSSLLQKYIKIIQEISNISI